MPCDMAVRVQAPSALLLLSSQSGMEMRTSSCGGLGAVQERIGGEAAQGLDWMIFDLPRFCTLTASRLTNFEELHTPALQRQPPPCSIASLDLEHALLLPLFLEAVLLEIPCPIHLSNSFNV